ncbi:MAG TPA: PhzF family phenazine biosynthesis protein [Jiangellaceae bacterium]|nr:PhzF family phenazine biosynthesis protein [Jiangellaceae bacterium]
MDISFRLVDVFSARPFGGNQLAVFTDADGLDDSTMQQLAREFNFSETTFVLPPQQWSHTCQLRIFTPHQELPFAGHPTIGTAAVLANSRPPTDHPQRYILEEGVGPVTVEVDGNHSRLVMSWPVPETTATPPTAASLANALSLHTTAVIDWWCAGVGLGFNFVRVATPEVVDDASLNRSAWEEGIADGWSPHLFVFAGELAARANLYARCFAPAVGVDEDAATGSACVALVASAVERSAPDFGNLHFEIDQGVAMGRPSRIEADARMEHGRLAEISVGGATTILGGGVITLDPSCLPRPPPPIPRTSSTSTDN